MGNENEKGNNKSNLKSNYKTVHIKSKFQLEIAASISFSNSKGF